MPKSLAELRQVDRSHRRAEAKITIYLRSEAAAEFDTLNEQLVEAVTEVETERRRRADGDGKPGRLADKGSDAQRRVDELSARLDELAEQMRDDTQVEIGLAPIAAGEWNRWKVEHPAREEGDGDDRRITRRDYLSGGRFNFDALVEALPRFIVSLNGDTPEENDWERVILPDATARDVDRVAEMVMNLHEGSIAIPKSRKLLLDALTRDDD